MKTLLRVFLSHRSVVVSADVDVAVASSLRSHSTAHTHTRKLARIHLAVAARAFRIKSKLWQHLGTVVKNARPQSHTAVPFRVVSPP